MCSVIFIYAELACTEFISVSVFVNIYFFWAFPKKVALSIISFYAEFISASIYYLLINNLVILKETIQVQHKKDEACLERSRKVSIANAKLTVANKNKT
jgi:hypothetical protein